MAQTKTNAPLSQLAALYSAHIRALQLSTSTVLTGQGYEALVIHSGTKQQRVLVDDNYWPLRPTPFFQHWAPLAEGGCALVIAPAKKPRLLRLQEMNYWEKAAPPETDHFWASFDVRELPAEQFKDEVPRGRVAFIGDDLSAATAWGVQAVNPYELLRALDQLRVHKSAYEELCLAEANRRAAEGHEALRKAFAQGDDSELALHLAYLTATRQDDSETPYKNIVALGVHAATLHHVSYEKRSRPAQSLLVDAGASFAGYASDITRTWVKGGGAGASAFGQLCTGLDAMQQRLCARAVPGLDYEVLHEEAHQELATLLREVGISKLSERQLVEAGITRAFFPHGLGHSLGLQVHDVGCALRKPKEANPFLRNTTTISERQTFTIEPGLYFIDALLAPLRQGPYTRDLDWSLIDALTAFGGIRIEDDVVVGPRGVRNLTREVLPS